MIYSLSTGSTVDVFVATDFLRRVKVDDINILNTLSYDEYDIQDGDTPEIVADKIYNSPDYHWVILIANEIIDPRFDWPLSTDALRSYITDKYGQGNEYAVHHYENTSGDTVHVSYSGLKTSINNTEYEELINESKRRIRLIKPQFVSMFIESFVGILNNGN